jgi:signal transduction histidine kinase
VSAVRRKRISQEKTSAKYPRKAGVKSAAQSTIRKEKPANFALLRAAHRGRMGAVLASATADRLREIAQIVGLAHDTNSRTRMLPPPVLQAMIAADTSLLAQIDALEQFAQPATDGPADLTDAVARAIAWCGHAAGCRDTDYVVELPRKLPAVSLDAADLQEILFALLVNARESRTGRNPARICVTAVATDGMVLLTVEDDGPGLTAALRKRVFGPSLGSRAGTSQVGMGLAVARQLAHNHGGDLQYDATGKGARFVLAMRAWRSPRAVGLRRTLQ